VEAAKKELIQGIKEYDAAHQEPETVVDIGDLDG
jgi:hypothetical protein